MKEDDDKALTDEMKTIGVIRIPRALLNEYALFIIILIAMGLGFAAFGAIQYYLVCKPKDDAISFLQCVSQAEKAKKANGKSRSRRND